MKEKKEMDDYDRKRELRDEDRFADFMERIHEDISEGDREAERLEINREKRS